MKASLQLKLGQHLTMTPQLQQAIRLLQLSSLELQQEIQEALENNPLLEIEEEFHSAEELNAEAATMEALTPERDSQRDTVEEFSTQEISEELPIDANWEDVFTSTPNHSNASLAADDDRSFQGETLDSLYQHLEWQKNLTPFSEIDLAIATAIIEAIDERGYLTQSPEDILEAMGNPEVELDEVEAVLKRIQHFDPIGIGARDLRECLLIQLQQYSPETPYFTQAKLLIDQHLSLIASRDFRLLMRKTKLKEEELRQAIQLIQRLNPRPGLLISAESNDYVIPDISVYKHNGRWQVELNPNNTPKLNVNQFYASMRNSRNQADNQFIRDHLQEAKWFIKSLESRNDTLLKVAKCIVQFQQGFFEFGPESMRPMVLNDVAQAVSMHESTISRVTTQKFMHTPRGIFELKYFFSSHVSTDDGGECSSTAIRALIKKLIAAENPKKPLSDSKIAELLAEQRINVARRTIAKYREAMLIPPSNQRKSL